MDHFDWVQSKGYSTDSALTPEQQVLVRRAARRRFERWPRLHERDTHQVLLGESPQRFCTGGPAVAGDPGDNVFVVSLPRRPSKLRHALHELHEHRVSATIVDAVDGDAILCQDDVGGHGVAVLPGYCGHSNHNIQLTTGEIGCFMSHYAIWQHMVDSHIESAFILEDDFDFQEGFAQRLGECLREADGEDWNILYVGRSPVEPDLRVVSEHVVEPGYTLWTVGYILRLDAARALLDARAHARFAPLDEYFSIAMGRYTTAYNEFAPEWAQHIPHVLRGLALTPPLVMPYVGSMFESDTAMLRSGTRYLKDLPQSISPAEAERQLRDPLVP
jgi:GR25 family glycosyltransferase involved in LPS biosynthesis